MLVFMFLSKFVALLYSYGAETDRLCLELTVQLTAGIQLKAVTLFISSHHVS